MDNKSSCFNDSDIPTFDIKDINGMRGVITVAMDESEGEDVTCVLTIFNADDGHSYVLSSEFANKKP